jgi:dihydrofolate synthase/folylpolyglutamate synthase
MIIVDGPGCLATKNAENYEEDWRVLNRRLFELSRRGMKLGLERLYPVLEKLGHPEKGTRFIHVAGTNGKGSVCAFLASVLGQAGKTVGVYTSPHLEDLTERVRFVSLDLSEDVSRAEMQNSILRIEAICPDFEPLTFFEVITLAALLLIQERKPDFAVIEAGMGARLDATRVIDAELSVLTDVDLEHQKYLGTTIEEILGEKLAVVRPDRPLVAAPGLAQVQEECTRLGSALYQLGPRLSAAPSGTDSWMFQIADRRIYDVQLGLQGVHQIRNALLATQAAILMIPELGDETIRAGLFMTRWPGRIEQGETSAGLPYLLDAAHNPAGALALAAFLRENPGAPWHFVFGAMSDKDLGQMLTPLIPFAASWSLTQAASPRSAQVAEIKRELDSLGVSAAQIYNRPTEAWSRARAAASSDGGTVVVCGSLFLLGELRGKLATGFGRVLP